MTSEYLIIVVTGMRKGAGTDASVSLVIKGKNWNALYLCDFWQAQDKAKQIFAKYLILMKFRGYLVLKETTDQLTF